MKPMKLQLLLKFKPTPTRWLPTAVLVAVGVMSGLPTQAQTVYRCGADGRSYSHQPCADGTGHRLQPDDPRSADDRAAAQAAIAREARAADRLERDRLSATAEARPGPAGLTATRAVKVSDREPSALPRPKARKHKTAAPSGLAAARARAGQAEFDAVVPKPAPPARRAER